jgi:hypothetical protein
MRLRRDDATKAKIERLDWVAAARPRNPGSISLGTVTRHGAGAIFLAISRGSCNTAGIVMHPGALVIVISSAGSLVQR